MKMSYRFKLLLNRVITDEEFAALGKAGCTGSTMTNVSLPLDDSAATRIDIDTEAANLAEAIQAALDAVKEVPGLIVTTLDVPPQPSGLPDEDEAEEEGGQQPAAPITGSVLDDAGPAPDADPAENGAIVADAATADAGPAANGKASTKPKTPAKRKASAKEDASGKVATREKAATVADATESDDKVLQP
jgi:hypothetical protein